MSTLQVLRLSKGPGVAGYLQDWPLLPCIRPHHETVETEAGPFGVASRHVYSSSGFWLLDLQVSTPTPRLQCLQEYSYFDLPLPAVKSMQTE